VVPVSIVDVEIKLLARHPSSQAPKMEGGLAPTPPPPQECRHRLDSGEGATHSHCFQITQHGIHQFLNRLPRSM
jgi:hypothetical protein